MLQHVGCEDDIERAILEGQASCWRNLEPDAILQTGLCDFLLADADQVGRNVNADWWIGEVDPLRKGDQDVADPTAEVEDPIVRRDAGCAQDAPIGGVDDPQPAPRKHVAHADPAHAAAEPLTVGLADRGLVDLPVATAHWPTLPAAGTPGRPPRSPPICPTGRTMFGHPQCSG